jgi:hypothetical protein
MVLAGEPLTGEGVIDTDGLVLVMVAVANPLGDTDDETEVEGPEGVTKLDELAVTSVPDGEVSRLDEALRYPLCKVDGVALVDTIVVDADGLALTLVGDVDTVGLGVI